MARTIRQSTATLPPSRRFEFWKALVLGHLDLVLRTDRDDFACVTFDEDRCRTRKDNSALNFAVIRHVAFNILKADTSPGPLRRKRIRACANKTFRSSIFAA